LIDLHLHTTASDGRLTPAELVTRVMAAGLTTISVTDHDTVKSIDEVTTLAAARGIRVVPGIEITAVDHGRDVHVLAYFIDHRSATLGVFLNRQRSLRVGRVREIGVKLAALGVPVDVEKVLGPSIDHPGTSVGRPQLAHALVAAGHVKSVQEAFDTLLATGQPAFVPRTGPSPADVVRVIHGVGGIASMAHPGVTKRDDLIGPLAEAGLDAIEVYHSDHDHDAEREYTQMANRFDVGISGGSDFHGDSSPAPERKRRSTLGLVQLPAEAFADLESRATKRQASQ
jgi:predicted metal-dependent phosphoesterase TrpH